MGILSRGTRCVKERRLGMAKPSPSHARNQTLVQLGQTIRQIRKAKGLSQEGLAIDAEMDRSYIGGVERGEHNLTLMGLQKIAITLKIDLSTLLKSAGL